MEMGFGSNNVDVMKKRTMRWVLSIWRTIYEVGQQDQRRVIHALKVGLSLTLVSLLYLMEPLFKGIGQNAIWAVITVVLVLDFTAGATLCKGFNRGLGTLLAGSLAFLMDFIAQESGAAATYIRFVPYIKKHYDYGVVIFLVTFNLITVSSYRVHNVLQIAHTRLYTVAIGCAICLVMSLFIFPNWSGQHLHNSSISKLEGLAYSIQACVNEYFSNEEQKVDKDESSEDQIYKGYKSVLDSKSTDETLALHASWEPCHSSQCYRVPWQQYVKLGDVIRHFGYTIVSLHGCLQTQIQTPKSIRALFKDPCTRVAAELHKALVELARSIRDQRQCSPAILSDHLHQALQDLDAALKSQPRLSLLSSNNTLSSTLHTVKSDEGKSGILRPTQSKNIEIIMSLEFSEALPFAAFASLLVEAVARLELVIEEVEELGRVANFREFYKDRDRADGVKVNDHLPPHEAADC
ncbi:aluminum-activated [Striga asiatica]|uniref:Aluminum-activated n=1 Tax=Striga asiatica TaxID=4170 RepID=A0A5A7QPR6_STRAF|nr:aluminum-activated [Striga asiatica]